MEVPTDLRSRIERLHGDPGRRWLDALSVLVSTYADRWSLRLDEPLPNPSYNLVLPGQDAKGKGIVLKLGVSCAELSSEVEALVLYAGRGAVRLLDHDASAGALLLERVVPGTPVHEGQNELEATTTAARLMKQLWREPPQEHSFPSLSIWFRAFARLRDMFDGGTGPFPSQLISGAESAFVQLNGASDAGVVLHGDLHHTNILLSQRDGWVAIDPKGVVGDRGYEIGSFMINQLPARESEIMEMMARRLSIFSEELQISRERLAQWSFFHAVLSAIWSFEDSEEWQRTIQLARLLERLI